MTKKRAKGESRARALTRSRLVDAAVEILVERGFAGTKLMKLLVVRATLAAHSIRTTRI